MRKLFLFLIVIISTNTYAFGEYDSQVTFSVAHLGFTTPDIMKAINVAMERYHWQTEEQTENSVVGNLNGSGDAKVKAEISGDTVTIRFLTQHDMQNYKYFKWLLNIKATMMVYLNDCKNKDLKSAATTDPAIVTRRNLVYAFYKYNWRLSELGEHRIVASLPARGRVEADYTASGLDRIRRWDEIEGDYTDPAADGYVRRIKRLFERQQALCK
jgi:hypothetical protein